MVNRKREQAPIDLCRMFGNIDVYLFDQLLKERFVPKMKVLDAGCGGGRNIIFFLQNGYEVFGVDSSPLAIDEVQQLAGQLAPHLLASNFRIEKVEQMSFADESFDAVISSAVLHFADDELHFRLMMGEMWRVLKRGGIFFGRLASTIGISNLVSPVGNGRYFLPDGSELFLVDERMLESVLRQLGGELLEPIKSVNVANMRSMAVWCWRKAM